MSTLHSIVNKFFDNSTPILYRQFQPEDLEKLPAISPLNWRSCSSKYRCRLLIGQDRVAKKPVHKAFYGPTEEAVRQRVVDYIRNELEGRTLFHAEQRLVSFQFEKWLRAEKLGRVRPRTYDRLEGTYRNQIKPYVEGIELRELNRSDCQRILRCNLEKGYAASTIRKTAILLKEFLQAKADEDPTFRNPMNGVKLFKDEYVEQWQASLRRTRDALRERQAAGQHLTEAETALANSTLQLESNREVRILTREEADRIKQIAREGCVRSWTSRNGKEVRSAPKPLQQTEFFLFMLNTGLRSGEARALRYSDVDFTNHRLTVSKNRVTVMKRDVEGNRLGGSECVDGKPKTRASNRTLFLSRAAEAYLKALLAREKKGYAGYIANAKGKALSDSNLRQRFDRLLENAGIEHCGLHALRHSFATYYYEYTGSNRVLVGDYLGHTSRNLTERVYVNLPDYLKLQQIRDFEI